jgi:hypothetical protein
MAKRITHEMTYDASLAEVAEMLADPAFRREVCDRQRTLRSAVTVEPASAGTVVTIEQFWPAQGMPSFVRKVVGDEIHVVQAESWHAADAADVTVTIPGKPGDMSGTARLAETGGVTTESVDLTVKVAIPLVGAKIEGLIADLLLRGLRTEEKVGKEWLARGR